MEDRIARELMELVSAEFQANRQLIHRQFQSTQQVVSEQCQAAQQSLASSQDRALGLISTRLRTELPCESCVNKFTVLDVSSKTEPWGAQAKARLSQTAPDFNKYLPMIEKEVGEEIRRRCSEVTDTYSDLLCEVGKLKEITIQNEERVQAMKLQQSRNFACVGTGAEDLQEEREEHPNSASWQQPAMTSEVRECAAEVQEGPWHPMQRQDVDFHSSSLVSLEPVHPAQDSELCDLRLQNCELLNTVEGFKQDRALLELENQRLRESAAAIESAKQKAASECAKLMGHSNPKQKIHYTVKLHEENNRLREDYQKLRKNYMKLEASRRGNLAAALPTFAALSLEGSSQHQSPTGAQIQLAADTGC